MKPAFPFELLPGDGPAKVVARLNQIRLAQAKRDRTSAKKTADTSIDDLLADADAKVEQRTGSKSNPDGPDVVAEAKRDVRNLNVRSALSSQSELRTQLAEFVVSPRNWYFSRNFVNRVWAELIGPGFVEPIDNFTAQNMPSHRKTIDYLGDEFVASGYDLRTLVRMIVTSEAYQRGHAVGVDEPAQQELEAAFLATPMRRMISESLFDSIVVAGHLFDVKHAVGQNIKTVWRQTRVAKKPADTNEGGIAQQLANVTPKKMEKPKDPKIKSPSYDLESAIELDFDALLNPKEDAANVEKMAVMSKEEIEAMRMAEEMQNRRPNVNYFDHFVKSQFDDNPRFGSSLRMVSPANPEHFLRVFGQTGRAELGEQRDDNPSMGQALMMLNGRLTHEASRVGELEAVYPLLVGKKANLAGALKLVYLEILTREPTAEEITEAGQIVKDADTSLDGMADLRWILLNCNEFRFLP